MMISPYSPNAGSPNARPGSKRLRASELVTTLTEDSAMAAPAITGLSSPNAANGTPMVL
jgi:hypothetical protein